MKHIVIAGAGFGGIRCALALDKRMPRTGDVAITLVDREPYHLAQAYLYEVATSPEELATLAQLKQSVVVPIADIIRGTRIKFLQAEIQGIDPVKRDLNFQHGKIGYDYLVLSLGSGPNFYGIPGAEQYSIPLKSVRDALALRNRLGFLLDAHRQNSTKQTLRLAVAGGGFAGVEVAAELAGLLDFLSWKENFPGHKLEIMVIEGAGQLMPGMPASVAGDTYRRLQELGVAVRLNSLITKVDGQFLEFNNGELLQYDCLIWTAGVKARQVPFVSGMEYDRSNRIVTNVSFQISPHPNIFVIGDEACFLDPTGKPLPGTARQAISQGKYVAQAIISLMENKKPKPYQCRQLAFIVPIGGKWAIFQSSRVYLKGLLPYLMRQIAWFHYFWSILGLTKAVQLVMLENRLYGRND